MAGEMVTFEGVPLNRVTITPPVGAGVDKTTGKSTTWPGTIVRLVGMLIEPGAATVIAAVAFGMFGVVVLAVMVAAPAATPVTVTGTVVAPALIVTIAGTVAEAALLDARLTVIPPAGAAVDKVSVRVWLAPAATFRLAGEKVNVAPTVTVWLAVV